MANKLKTTGTWLLRFVAYVALGAILELFILNANWLSGRVLPWFFQASTLALAFVVLVALPLSAFRRCRRFSAGATHIASYVFFATLLMWAVVLTLLLWGTWPVVIGLFMMVVGVVPIAMLATLFAGVWTLVGQLLVLTGLTIGARLYASWIGDRADAPVEIQESGAVG